MKNYLIALLLFTSSAYAQDDRFVIKTRAVHSFYARNPNLGVEFRLSKHWSVSGEYLYRRNMFLADLFGAYQNMGGRLHPAQGYKALFELRYYLVKTKREAPFGWYLGLAYGYNYAYTGSFIPSNESSGWYYRAIDYEARWRERTYTLGVQFHLFKVLTADLFLGAMRPLSVSNKATIVASDSISDIGKPIETWKWWYSIMPNAGCKVGFHF